MRKFSFTTVQIVLAPPLNLTPHLAILLGRIAPIIHSGSMQNKFHSRES